MKVKAVRTVGSGRIRGLETACGALPARLDRSVGEAALERTRWDPKDCELCRRMRVLAGFASWRPQASVQAS